MKPLRRAIGWLDDAINPIVVKELRQAVRSRFVQGVLMLFLIGLFLVTLLYVMSEPDIERSFEAGGEITLFVYSTMVIACMLFVPLYTGIRLAAERGDVYTDLTFITTIRPGAIARGKTLSAVALTVLIASVCMPFMTFTYLLRGVDLTSIFFILAIAFVAVIGVSQAAMFVAALPVNRLVKAVVGLIGMVGAAFVAAGCIAIAEDFIRGRMSMFVRDFWIISLSMLAMAVAIAVLFHLFTVALLSPPSANRSLPIRIYLTLIWAAGGAVAAGFSWHYHHDDPILVWGYGAIVLFSITMLAAVGERRSWGPRVRRRIPRWRVLRAGALLFYTGAAGGVLWCLILMALTVILTPQLLAHSGLTAPKLARCVGDVEVMIGLGLYAFFYFMTATLIRDRLLARWIPTACTGMIALIFAAVVSLLPFLLDFLLISRSGGWYRPYLGEAKLRIWLLPNPVYGLLESVRMDALPIVAGAATFIAVLAGPWWVRQVAAFRPLPRPNPAPAEPK